MIASPVGAYFNGGVKPVTVWVSAGLHPGGARRHRRGQVRRQLRRQPRRPGRGDRARLRPGGLPRRGGAAVRRRARRHERLLRLRRRHAGHAAADRHDPARHHPRRDPHPGRATAARGRASGRSALDEWRADAASGRLREAFACGTAAVITPIGTVRSPDGEFIVADGGTGRGHHGAAHSSWSTSSAAGPRTVRLGAPGAPADRPRRGRVDARPSRSRLASRWLAEGAPSCRRSGDAGRGAGSPRPSRAAARRSARNIVHRLGGGRREERRRRWLLRRPALALPPRQALNSAADAVGGSARSRRRCRVVGDAEQGQRQRADDAGAVLAGHAVHHHRRVGAGRRSGRPPRPARRAVLGQFR